MEKDVKTAEEKHKGQIMALDEKNKGQVKMLDETIKTAEERAKKESLQQLFNIITKTEYESAKKAIGDDRLKDRLKQEVTKAHVK